MIHGYHKNITIWPSPVIEENLSCKQEIGNAHNTIHAVAVHKTIDGERNTAISTSLP